MILTLVRLIEAVLPPLPASADMVNRVMSVLVHFGMPIVKLGLWQVGNVWVVNPFATVMLWQVKLLKEIVPFTTQTLFPVVAMKAEAVIFCPGVNVEDAGKTLSEASAALTNPATLNSDAENNVVNMIFFIVFMFLNL